MRNPRPTRIGLILLAVALGMLVAAPATARAQASPSDSAQVRYRAESPGATASSSAEPGAENGLSAQLGPLPFTGLDLIILAAVSVALTGAALALRRLSMPRRRA